MMNGCELVPAQEPPPPVSGTPAPTPPASEDSAPAFVETAIEDRGYIEGAAIVPFTLPAATGGDGTLTYSLTSVPGLEFEASTRTLSGTPSESGTYEMAYTVSDSDGDRHTLSFRITVNAVSVMNPQAAANIASVQEDSVMFSQPVGHSVGDFVVAGVTASTPQGMLREVIAVSADQRSVTTRQATLEDVISDGRLRYVGELLPSDLTVASRRALSDAGIIVEEIGPSDDVAALDNSLAGAATGRIFGFRFTYPNLAFTSGDYALLVNGSIEFSLSYEVDVVYRWGRIQSALFSVTPQVRDNLRLEFSAADAVPSGFKKIGDLEWKIVPPGLVFSTVVVPVGPIPVTLTPTFAIYLGVTGTGSVTLETTRTGSVEIGVECRQECRYLTSWNPIINPSVDFTVDEATIGAELKLYVRPELGLKLYGVVGPVAGVELFALAGGQGGLIHDGQQYQFGAHAYVDVGASASLGVRLDIPDAIPILGGKTLVDISAFEGIEIVPRKRKYEWVDRAPTFGAEWVSDKVYVKDRPINNVRLPPATDGDPDLTYSLAGSAVNAAPVTEQEPHVPGLRFNRGTRVLSGTPTSEGAWDMTYKVVDVDGDTAYVPTFRITVEQDQSAPPPALSIADASVTEGDSGSSSARFIVTLSSAPSRPVTVQYRTSDGTATAGTDYTGISGRLTFSGKETRKTIAVTVWGDTVDENDERFTVSLSHATNATISRGTATGTIRDDDVSPPPELSIADASVTEGDRGSSSARFSVTLSSAPSRPVTVRYRTADGTATAGADYGRTSGTLTFGQQETQKTVVVTVWGDTLDESDERFTVSLSHATNATISRGTAVGTIRDDDASPELSIADASVTEGDSGSSSARFRVTLSSASARPVTVQYRTSDGTATAGTDYDGTSGTLTFSRQETQKTVVVTVWGDTLDESDERFTVSLSHATNATITRGTATGTIRDDDAAPELSIADASVTEGDSGSSSARFRVTLSSASARPVTVQYRTSDGTARAGTDYDGTSGTLTFSPQETQKTIVVTVWGDTLDESDERFTVSLSNATNATITRGTATGTIRDDDASPELSIADASVTEGDRGSSSARFRVTLSSASARPVTVRYRTADGTATAGTDYDGTSGTLTFSRQETQKTVVVTVWGDTLDESDERFTVSLSNAANATISRGTATGTIRDDDASPPPELSIADANVTEGDSGSSSARFRVTLSSASARPVTVQYRTSDGTATAGTDYDGTSGTLTFSRQETQKTVVVTVWGDTLDESDESFTVSLSHATNATITRGTATGTIRDDDAAPELSIADANVTEGDSGSSSARFRVTLSSASTRPVTVRYRTWDGTATAGTDYDGTSGTLTFSRQETQKTIVVTVWGDTLDENDERFTVSLSNATNATITRGTATGTIRDDDVSPPPELSIADASVTEGDSGSSSARFRVTLSSASARPVTVQYRTSDGTATAGTDYDGTSGTLTFSRQETQKTVVVTVWGDTLDESDERFTVSLSNATNATITRDTATGTIRDDDDPLPLPSLSIADASITEGDSGTTNAMFTVTLSSTSAQQVTVSYATSNGTATAGSDYTATSGTLTFSPGDSSNTIGVAVGGDTVAESDETFIVTLSNASNATISDATATGTIENDDSSAAPDLVAENARVSSRDRTVDTGESFTLRVTIRNKGTGRSASTRTRYYRSTDSTISSSDHEEDDEATPALDPEEQDSESESITAPSSPGTYYYGACVDAVAAESDTTNNCSNGVRVEVEEPGSPDLIISSFSAPSTVQVGTLFTLRATVRNAGNGAAPRTILRYYLTNRSGTSRVEGWTDSVAGLDPNETSNESQRSTSTDTVTYYYMVCVDSVSRESDTGNNCSPVKGVTAVLGVGSPVIVQGVSCDLNVRTGAGTSNTAIDALCTGATGTILAGPSSANGYTWWRVGWRECLSGAGCTGWSVEFFGGKRKIAYNG